MSYRREISVIMPALNEERNIERAISDVLKNFSSMNIDGELLLVNDGSTDQTLSIMEKFRSANPKAIKILIHEKPQGIGACFRDGIKQAAKDVVVYFPGDAENDCSETFRYLDLMEHVDIVVPFVINKEVRAPMRNFLSGLFLWIINTTFGLPLNYTNGTTMYRRSILADIEQRETGFFYQVEVLIKAIKRGYIFAEVPYRLSQRSSGVSKAVSLKSFKKVFIGFLRLICDIYFSNTYSSQKAFSDHSKTRERR